MASLIEISVFFLVFMLSDMVNTSYPFSVSRQECQNMIPTVNGARPQSSATKPFKLTVVDTIYHDDPIGVTIEMAGKYPLKGIMLQARRTGCDHVNQSIPVGMFMEPIDNALKVVNCSGYNDTVINRSWRPIKRNIEVKWHSNKYIGTIFFIATFVSTDKLYWTDVTSEPARHFTDKSKNLERCPSSNLYSSGNNGCLFRVQFALLITLCSWNFINIFMYL